MLVGLAGMHNTALERQGLSCNYLAHHELKSVLTIIHIPKAMTTLTHG